MMSSGNSKLSSVFLHTFFKDVNKTGEKEAESTLWCWHPRSPCFRIRNFLSSGYCIPENFIDQNRGTSRKCKKIWTSTKTGEWRSQVRYAVCKGYSAISAEEIGRNLFERRDVRVSTRMIQMSLDWSGLSKVKRKNKPLLTDDNMVKRVSLCTRNLAFSFDNVMITDECLFNLHRNTLKYWTRRETNPRIAVAKYSVSIMVWGTISKKRL